MGGLKMRLTYPFAPVSASRPNWNTKTGKLNSRSYMPKRYADWRIKADRYFEKWLKEREYKPLEELLYMDKEKQVLAKENGVFNSFFYGYRVRLLIVLPQTNKKIQRAFPLSANQADIDNYSKAVIDSIFQSATFKRAKIDDRFIQDLHAKKRLCMRDEEPHTDIEITMIRGDE